MILLLDADIPVYAYASSNQQTFVWDEETTSVTTDLPKAKDDIDSFIERTMRTTRCKEVLCALSSVEKNFRFGVLPTYKHNRKGTARPVLREALNDYILATYPTKRKPTIEGDDVLGILATAYPGKYLIATIDKDLRQIPGSHYNWFGAGKFFTVTKAEGDAWFYAQCLQGDMTDGYSGCPGFGKVAAQDFIDSPFYWESSVTKKGKEVWEKVPTTDIWRGIVSHYVKKGLTEADALVQARCARILQHTDYNFKTDEVILWNPQ